MSPSVNVWLESQRTEFGSCKCGTSLLAAQHICGATHSPILWLLLVKAVEA
jgi:hypothetical protein